MIIIVDLTKYAAGRSVAVNACAIAYLDVGGDSTVVAFGSGEQLRVSETPGEIKQLIAEAVAAERALEAPERARSAATVGAAEEPRPKPQKAGR